MTAPKPKRPKNLPQGRWLGDFPRLSAAEKALVAACARGEVWTPVGWDGKRPDKATAANTIRAALIRFLVLGGDAEHPVHEEGVALRGAWIANRLNLHQAQASVRLDARQCHFAEAPNFMKASLPELALRGSHCPGIAADGLKVTGALYLRDGCHATGEVRLLGAAIGGDLDCSGGRFENADGKALNADGVTVKGTLLLRSAVVKGIIDLAAARVGTLVDGDPLACWQGGRHILDGFQYDRIMGFTDAATRIKWLKLQREKQLTTDFRPQPWEQLIKVLREMGHPDAASEVAIAKQAQMRVAGVIKGPLRRSLHWLYGRLAGYGHRPMRTVGWMAAVWLACAFFFQVGGTYGYFGPTSPLLTNPQLAAQIDQTCGHRGEKGKQVWTTCSAMPAEYTTFQPVAYSADLILPLVNLQQEEDWAPIVSVPSGESMGFGIFLRFLMWFEILFGWLMSLMLVAVLGRLVDKD